MRKSSVVIGGSNPPGQTTSINSLDKSRRFKFTIAAGTGKACSALPVCPLCKAQDNEERFVDHGYSLRLCHMCELSFIHPYPEIDAQHRRVSVGQYEEIELLDPSRRYLSEIAYFKRRFPMIAEECRGARSVLDVGCGTGHLLERLSVFPELHRQGLELNAAPAEYARRVANCEIHQIPLEEFKANSKFDVITMINVFSHIPTFDGLFNSARSLLQPGGKLILWTSEMGRGATRWSQFVWGIPDDLHFLGLRTLDFACQKYHFKITRRTRIAYADEVFLPSRWKQAGRSRFRNTIKYAVAATPLALPALKVLYNALVGKELFLSFIVLTPALSTATQGDN